MPMPAQRPVRQARVAWIVAAIAGIILSGGVGLGVGYYLGDHQAQIAAAAQVAGAGSGSCRRPAIGAGQLLAGQLLPLPAGATPATGAMAQRVLTVQQYANLLYPGRSSETTELQALCFQAAAHQWWRGTSGTIVSVWLIQFGDQEQARSYTRYTEQGDLADPANTGHFQVAGIADGVGIVRPSVDKYGYTLTRALGDKGSTVILMHVLVLGTVAPPNSVRALMLAQAARL